MSIQEIVFWVLFIIMSWVSYIAFWVGILAIPAAILYGIYRLIRKLLRHKSKRRKKNGKS